MQTKGYVMKDIIIEAGQRLGKYLREELDGRVTQLNTKRLNAVATDLLPGEKYAHIRLFMELCERHHLLVKYAESDLERDARVGDIVHTLKEKALITGEPGRCCAALVVIICEGTPDAESFAKRLMEGETQKTETPTPVPTQPQAQPQNNQPAQPTLPTNNPTPTTPEAQKGTPLQTTVPVTTGGAPDFDIENGVLKKYTGNSESIIIPNIVTEIGEKAFCECASIKNITIPTSVTIIGHHSFYKCKGVESITVIEGNPVFHSAGNCLIKTDAKTLVLGCKNSVIPSDGSVTIIGSSAFNGCIGLTNITIPEGVTRLGYNAFYYCDSLLHIKIPGSVKTIHGSAFQGCANLKSVEIGDGVESIWLQAFCGCPNLERINIPKSVKDLGPYVFSGCPKLTIYKAGGLNIFEKMFGTKWNSDKRPVIKI